MNPKRALRGRRGPALAACLLLAASPPALAQEISWSSSVETDGDDLSLVYTQLSLVADGLGWKPVGTLAGYWVGAGGGHDTWALTPQVGMRYRADVGFFQAKVGYSFKNDDAVDFFGGSENGVVTNAHGEYWGDGTWALQGIGSYNWGSEYLWSRARVLRRVADVGDGGGVSLGGEVVWQGDMGEEDGLLDVEEFSALQVGPVLHWVTGGATVWSVSGGWKDIDPGDESTWYLKLELSVGS